MEQENLGRDFTFLSLGLTCGKSIYSSVSLWVEDYKLKKQVGGQYKEEFSNSNVVEV